MVKIRNFILAGIFSLANTLPAYANDIYIGTKGPTEFQADDRIGYSRNEKGVKTLANNLILKYWDGDELGIWANVNLPYKFIDSPQGSNHGLGDISAGLGPRGRIGKFHWFLYSALAFPTGESEGNVPLGNGRSDFKIGGLATYLTDDKKFEVDGTMEYALTGRNKKGVNPPDEINAGLLSGGKVTDEVRLATGLTGVIKDGGDHSLNWRSVARYTVSQRLHFELVADVGIDSENIPKSNAVSLFARHNF